MVYDVELEPSVHGIGVLLDESLCASHPVVFGELDAPQLADEAGVDLTGDGVRDVQHASCAVDDFVGVPDGLGLEPKGDGALL